MRSGRRTTLPCQRTAPALPGDRPALVHGRERDACPARHALDVYRGEDGSYHVEADLPGADPDSVEVPVEHGVLMIQAGRTPHYGDSGQVIVAEPPQGSFARQLSLGEGVDSENLTAGYAGGVLHVTIPGVTEDPGPPG
jgi:HSP20 family molecular chaperone IbpA